MKVQEEFVHFFHNVDSFREIQEENIPVTDVTAFPARSKTIQMISSLLTHPSPLLFSILDAG